MSRAEKINFSSEILENRSNPFISTSDNPIYLIPEPRNSPTYLPPAKENTTELPSIYIKQIASTQESQKLLKKNLNHDHDLLPLKSNLQKITSSYLQNVKFNKNVLQIKSQTTPGITIEPATEITIDNIAEFAYPIAQFIAEIRPDYIFACDRGARMIGLATHLLYRRLYGNLPTRDRSIHFRKISSKVPETKVRTMLEAEIAKMLTEVAEPTVLVLDDWVNSGRTKQMVERLFDELSGGKIAVVYGVMKGSGANVSGNTKAPSGFPIWNDYPEIIGVDYNDDLQPHKISSYGARRYRHRMSRGIQAFVRDLRPLERLLTQEFK